MVIKLIFLILVVLLASTIFVLGPIMNKRKGDSTNDKTYRILLRVRLGCFLGMLIALLVVVLLT